MTNHQRRKVMHSKMSVILFGGRECILGITAPGNNAHQYYLDVAYALNPKRIKLKVL